ncbi:MAG: hypothetical protein AAGA56_13815 [Myxococcota bacterium]
MDQPERPSFGVSASDLAPPDLERLRETVAAHGGSSELTSGNLGGEVGAILIGALFWAGAVFNISMGNYGAAGGGFLLGLLLVGWGARKVKKRRASPLGSFELATEAYLILSDGGQMKVLSLAHLEAFELEHIYVKRVYQRTIMKCRFADGAWASLGDVLPADARNERAVAVSPTFRRVLAYAEQAKSALGSGRWAELEGAQLFRTA